MRILEKAYGRMTPIKERYGNGPCHYYKIEEFQGKIGFISAMTHKFCDQCNRVRMTAEGFLKSLSAISDWNGFEEFDAFRMHR